MRAIHIKRFGDKLGVSLIPKPEAKPNYVLIKTKYVPINLSDIYYSYGKYAFDKTLPRTIGFEGSGEVVEAGNDSFSQSLIGKNVAFFGKGTWAEYSLAQSSSCIVYEGNLSENQFQNICSSFVNPLSALGMLFETEQRGEKCIVQSASRSALGGILIRAAKKRGIKTINIVRKEEHLSEILKNGGDYAVNSSDPNFEKILSGIFEIEKPLSFYDAVGGDFLSQVFALMPNKSTTYNYGILSLKTISNLDSAELIFKEKALKGFWLSAFLKNTPQEKVNILIDEIANNIHNYCSSVISKVYDAEDVREAIAFYQANMSQGKVLLKF